MVVNRHLYIDTYSCMSDAVVIRAGVPKFASFDRKHMCTSSDVQTHTVIHGIMCPVALVIGAIY